VPEKSFGLIWWGTTALSLVALLLVVGNILLAIDLQKRQAEVNQRQQFINQSVELSRANQLLINTLAQVAAKNDDVEIRELLAANGITFSISDPAVGALSSKPAAK
jgi:hypothetical protein